MSAREEEKRRCVAVHAETPRGATENKSIGDNKPLSFDCAESDRPSSTQIEEFDIR